MKKTSLLFLSLIAMLFSVSCEKIENPFKGTDNHILSFSVVQGDKVYKAAISGNEITVTVPVGTDLKGATAEIVLSEQATILPDPATISDWNGEMAFQVTSYSEATQDYLYRVNRTEVVTRGNVTLLTQADVDEFAKTGNTVIEGNLVIGASSAVLGEQDTIRSLEGLSILKEVKYNVYVNGTFGGTSLKGLDNLESVGAFFLGSHTSSVKTFHSMEVELPALRNAGSVVINSPSVTSVKFPVLKTTSGLRVTSNTVESIEAPELEEIAGDLLLINPSNVINAKLLSVGFPKLRTVTGRMDFQFLTKVEKIGFPELSTVGGDINFQFNSNDLKEIVLDKLANVAGGMSFEKIAALEKVSMPKVQRLSYLFFSKMAWDQCSMSELNFPVLEEVAGEIMIKNLAKIETIAFPRLARVAGLFTIRGCKSMSNLDLSALREVQKLFLWDLNLIPRLDFSKIESCDSYEFITLAEDAELIFPETVHNLKLNIASKAYIPKFSGVRRVTGDFTFDNAQSVENMQIDGIEYIRHFFLTNLKQDGQVSFPDAKEIRYLELSLNEMKTLNAPQLAKIDTLDLSYMWTLTEFNLPKLKTVKYFLLDEQGGSSTYYEQFAKMTDLSLFGGITSVEEVKIQNAAKLEDFSAFGEISQKIADGKWSVVNCKYNPTLEDMKAGRYTPAKTE